MLEFRYLIVELKEFKKLGDFSPSKRMLLSFFVFVIEFIRLECIRSKFSRCGSRGSGQRLVILLREQQEAGESIRRFRGTFASEDTPAER